MDREARARSTRSARTADTVEMMPRLAPWVRRWRVRERVSISLIPTTPCWSR